MRVSTCSLLTLGLLTLVAGCDSPSSAQTQGPAVEVREVELVSPFPDAATLMDLAAKPRPAADQLFGRPVADVDAWTMKSSGATAVEAAAWSGDDRNAGVAAQLLAEDSTGRKLTRGMQCLATEVGSFVLAHGAEPAADIEAFMAARCGTPVANPRISVTQMAAGGAKPLHAERDKARLTTLFGAMGPGAHVGLYKGRDKAKGAAVEVVVSGVPEVELSGPVPLTGHAGEVELGGTVAWEFDNLVGWATQGAQGAAPCVSNGPMASPAFSLRCPVAAGETTMVELHAVPKGELLERRVLRMVVTDGPSASTTYKAAALPVPAAEGRDEATVVNAINALRLADQLPALAGVEAQSKVLGALMPHYVAASADPAQATVAAQAELGMLAGREIGSDLLHAGVLVTAAPSARGLERELAAALASPRARSLVFDPLAKHLAFTTTEDQALGMRRSALAVYAEPAAETDYSADVTAYLDALDQQRQAAGLPPVTRGEDPADLQQMQAAVSEVYAGTSGPAQALDKLLRYIAGKTNRGFKGRIDFPHRLAGWSPVFSGSLVEAEEVTVLAVIGRMQVQDGWGRPMVVVLYDAKEPPAPATPPATEADPAAADPAAADPAAADPATTPPAGTAPEQTPPAGAEPAVPAPSATSTTTPPA